MHKNLGEAFFKKNKPQVLFGTLHKHLEPHDFLTLKCERMSVLKTLLKTKFICFSSALSCAKEHERTWTPVLTTACTPALVRQLYKPFMQP